MLTLYHNDMSTCAQKVRLALDEIGLEWESRHLKLRGDEQLRPEFLAINPKGQVPALVDGDLIVVESTVINECLVDSRGVDHLLPRYAAGRSTMRWWTRQIDDDVFASIGTLSQAISFRHQYLANEPEVLSGKAYLALSSGGVYSQGPFAGVEHLATYLTAILGFLGIRDVEVVRAEGVAYGPDQDKAAMASAQARIGSLIGG